MLTRRVDRPDGHLLPSAFVAQIQGHLEPLYEAYLAGKSAVDIHRAVLAKHAAKWAQLFSSETCLVCLRRRPQIGMACGHYVCEPCVAAFGDACDGDRWLFTLNICCLCQAASHVALRIHPPTAGVILLCIDGGGVRGIIPPSILELLEKKTGLPIPIQEYFQMAIGISAGKPFVRTKNIRDTHRQPFCLCSF